MVSGDNMSPDQTHPSSFSRTLAQPQPQCATQTFYHFCNLLHFVRLPLNFVQLYICMGVFNVRDEPMQQCVKRKRERNAMCDRYVIEYDTEQCSSGAPVWKIQEWELVTVTSREFPTHLRRSHTALVFIIIIIIITIIAIIILIILMFVDIFTPTMMPSHSNTGIRFHLCSHHYHLDQSPGRHKNWTCTMESIALVSWPWRMMMFVAFLSSSSMWELPTPTDTRFNTFCDLDQDSDLVLFLRSHKDCFFVHTKLLVAAVRHTITSHAHVSILPQGSGFSPQSLALHVRCKEKCLHCILISYTHNSFLKTCSSYIWRMDNLEVLNILTGEFAQSLICHKKVLM